MAGFLAAAVGFSLIAAQWGKAEGKLETGIIAVGISVASAFLAVQLNVDDRRADADDRRQLQLNINQDNELDGASLVGENLNEFSFLRKSLRGTDLSRSDINGTDFTRASLQAANLTDVRGNSPIFIDAALLNANFGGAILDGADFTGAGLAGANLAKFECRNCDFRGAFLTGADLTDARLDGSLADATTIWPPAIEPAELGVIDYNGDLSNKDLRAIDLRGVSFVEADLTGADLRGVDLSGAAFSRVNISGTDFRGTDLTNTTFAGVTLNDATRFDTRPTITDALDLSADTPTVTSGAMLRGVTLESPAKIVALSGVDLRGGSIVGLDLSNLDLSGADLRRARLVDVKLAGAKLAGADLRGADLSRVDAAQLAATVTAEPWLGTQPTYFDADTKLPPGFKAPATWLRTGVDVDLLRPGTSDPILLNWILNDLDLPANEGATITVPPGNYTNLQAVGADLRGWNFSEANLYIAEMRATDLRGSRFDKSSLLDATLSGAALDTVPTCALRVPPVMYQPTPTGESCASQFSGAVYDSGTIWPLGYEPPADAIDVEGDLTGLQIGKRFLGANNLPGTRANGADLSGSDLSSSNFASSTFVGTALIGITAESTKFAGSDLRGADLSGSSVKNANLRGVDLRGANLHCVDLRGTDLTGALIDHNALAKSAVSEATTLPHGYTGEALSVTDDGVFTREVCEAA